MDTSISRNGRWAVIGRASRIIGAAVLVSLAVSVGAIAQTPTLDAQKKLASSYLKAEAAGRGELGAKLDALPALTKADVSAWTAWLKRELKSGTKLEDKGTNYFYDAKQKRGKYIVSGAGNTKGLVFGLHGGGVGSADCTGAASAFRGVIENAGMIGIYPEAIEATEAAWGDDVTVTFLLDLLAAAKRTFNFDLNHVYVIGHSMGGYGAWTWGGRFSDRLAAVVSFAGSPTPIWGASKDLIGIQQGVLANLYTVPIWVYHSTDDPRVPIQPVQFAIAELKRMKAERQSGFDFVYEEVEKRGHDFPAKGPGPAMTWAASKTRTPRPKVVMWEPFYERPDRRYWIAAERPARGVGIEGRWDGKSSFAITGSGARDDAGISVLLSDAMTDLDKPVVVKVGDKTVFEGVPKRTLRALLDSFIAREDPDLLFSAMAPPRP